MSPTTLILLGALFLWIVATDRASAIVDVLLNGGQNTRTGNQAPNQNVGGGNPLQDDPSNPGGTELAPGTNLGPFDDPTAGETGIPLAPGWYQQ